MFGFVFLYCVRVILMVGLFLMISQHLYLYYLINELWLQ